MSFHTYIEACNKQYATGIAREHSYRPALQNLLEASATDLPFEDHAFDAICASQVFCFIEDINQALSEAWRVLKPGGK